MILLIDNYDSFTHNLSQQLESLGYATKVVTHDKISIKQIQKLKPTHIVISPGPGRPEDGGISMAVIKKFYKTTPVLGVCLGHECIGQIFGAKIVQAKQIMHGKTSVIQHTGQGLFKNLPNPFSAARYHSLVINKVPPDFTLTAWTDDNEIMGVAHKMYPLYGVQFHPESFMTEHGSKLLANFLHLV
ncbi:MAG: aminodeoxychorismate/anthranilate synthase component II [bacterium]|nr:aminodeoxychorismate/anthranilate synthase component II [bacterium]